MTNTQINAHGTEHALLSCIFKHPEQLQRVTAEGITVESFAAPEHQQIFTAMQELAAAGITIDLVSVAQKTQMPDEVGRTYVDEFVLTENVPGWIQQLREYEARRYLYAKALSIAAAAEEENRSASLEEAIADMETAAEKAKELSGGKLYPSLKEIKDEFIKTMIEAPPPTIPMFPAGTEGQLKIQIHKGEMFVLGGVTGTGKTAFCCGAVLEQLKAGLVVAYFCTESTAVDILARLAAAETGVSHFEASKQNRNDNRLKMLAEGGTRIAAEYDKQLFLHGCDSGEMTPDTIRSRCQSILNQAGRIDVIYIDFLQDVRPRKHLRDRPKLEQINDVVDEIHSIMIKFKAAGIIPAQFNRISQNQPGRPGATSFRDTSSIEQKAASAAILWRENGETLLYTCKTRNQLPFESGIPLTWTGTKYESKLFPGPRPVSAEYGPQE